MKVLQVFNCYPMVYQPYIGTLVTGLKENEKINLLIRSYSSDDVSINRPFPSYKYRRFKNLLRQNPFSRLRNLSYLEAEIIRHNVDIFHLQDSFLFPKILNFLKDNEVINKPKIVVTLKGADTYVKPHLSDKWKLFFNKYSKNIDLFIVMSENHKLELIKLGIKSSKISAVTMPFGQPRELNTPKSVSTNKIKIVSCFRMCWEKNILCNILTVKNLVDKGFDVSYDLFGDGPDFGQVFYLAELYNLTSVIKCHGKTDNKVFKNKLKDFDFYLQLSVSESAGVTVLEAQSQGLPCIVSDSGGLPEMIIDNKTGFAVPLYNHKLAALKIIDLFTNKNKYTQFSKQGISYVDANFTGITQSSKLYKAYTKLIDEY